MRDAALTLLKERGWRELEPRYPGVCAACGGPVRAGRKAAWWHPKTKQLLHISCANSAPYVDSIRDIVLSAPAPDPAEQAWARERAAIARAIAQQQAYARWAKGGPAPGHPDDDSHLAECEVCKRYTWED